MTDAMARGRRSARRFARNESTRCARQATTMLSSGSPPIPEVEGEVVDARANTTPVADAGKVVGG